MDERGMAAALPGLSRLGELRERRALAALGEADRALDVAREARDTQCAVVERIERELATLVGAGTDGSAPTVDSLRLAAARREWLHGERKREDVALNAFEERFAEAEAIVAAARRDWLHARERGAETNRRAVAFGRDAARRAERRAERDADDGGATVVCS